MVINHIFQRIIVDLSTIQNFDKGNNHSLAISITGMRMCGCVFECVPVIRVYAYVCVLMGVWQL